MLYMVVMGLTKAAILMLYWRVFPTPSFRKLIVYTLVVCGAYIISFSMAVIFHCTPISFGWNGWTGEMEGHCVNFNAFAWAHAIVNIVFDIFVLILPIPELLKLHISRRRLAHLLLMFSVGLV